ncbi:MAG: hypothetical protein VKL60_00410 [Sphaerospermopsis sp.]|nr:hypothetical protein [Sphaerospermopsis sp.]
MIDGIIFGLTYIGVTFLILWVASVNTELLKFVAKHTYLMMVGVTAFVGWLYSFDINNEFLGIMFFVAFIADHFQEKIEELKNELKEIKEKK